MEALPDTEWTSADLLGRLERRDRFFVLDVRNRDEFEKFRLEGRSPLPWVNVPYFEMLELGGMDEMVDSVAAYVESELAGQLPRDLTILSVCAKGDTSQFVGQGLRRLGYLERQPEWWDESLGRARPSLCHGGVLPPAPLRCDPSDGCRPRDHSIRADPGWPGLPHWTAPA